MSSKPTFPVAAVVVAEGGEEEEEEEEELYCWLVATVWWVSIITNRLLFSRAAFCPLSGCSHFDMEISNSLALIARARTKDMLPVFETLNAARGSLRS